MSSMFKSMLSSLSAYPMFPEQQQDGPTIEEDSDDDSDLFVECHTTHLELPKETNSTSGYSEGSDTIATLPETITTSPTMPKLATEKKQNFGKRSKKKLRSMMSKIQLLTTQTSSKSKKLSANKTSNGLSNGSRDIISEQQTKPTIDYQRTTANASSNGKLACLKQEQEHKLNGSNIKHQQQHKTQKFDLVSSKKKAVDKVEEISLQDDDDDDGKAAFVLPEEQCDIPTFLNTKNCDRHLIDETRRLLRERYVNNPDAFYDEDYSRMLNDDWTVSRFLLRRRLDPKRTAKLMEECGVFRKQYKMSEVKLWEFPVEFHKAGGLFKYAPDRVGNMTLYMRVKMYRRVPEISDVFKAWILCILEECDRENNGRGTAVIFDLTGCGLQNVDLGFLSWLLSSFRNYCPKGVSYIIVYNLPWFLNATCKLAMTWMSASNRRALRFVHGDEIENFIAPENLPDYCGGSCKLNYKAIPDGSLPATEVCGRLDMTRDQALKIREMFKDYLDDDDDNDKQAKSNGKKK